MGGLPARRPKIDEHRTEAILDALKDGGTYEMAAANANISRKTLYNWLRKGREAREAREDPQRDVEEVTPWDDLYIDFLEAVEEAELEIKKTLVGRIKDAGKDYWQANAWIAERRWPEEFSQRKQVEHLGGEGEVKFTLDLGDKEPAEDPEEIEGDAKEADWEIVDDED